MLLLMLKFHQKLNNQTIKVKEREMVTDQLKEFQLDIHLIEEVELVDKTDQEKKVEDTEMLVMPRMNLTRTNMNNLKVKSQPKPLKKFQLNKLNHKSHQNQLLLSTIKARVSISTLLPKRRLQSEVKSTLNGLRKKSWLLLKPKKTRESKKPSSKVSLFTTVLRLKWTWVTLDFWDSEPSQLQNKENNNLKLTTETSRERNPQKLFLRKTTSQLFDRWYLMKLRIFFTWFVENKKYKI